MGESLTKMREQVSEYFKALDKKQKIKLGISSLLILLTVAGLILYISNPKYKVLYSSLTYEESGQIGQKLEELGITYKATNSGTAIEVKEKDLNKARMNLAIQGYPSTGITWQSAFESNSLTMTNEDKQKKYLQATMNQLAETVEEISGVDSAKVLLTVPDSSAFILSDSTKASASVKLTLTNNYNIQDAEVSGIATLVANAVEGLEVENVSVHDETGKVLNKPIEDSNSYSMNKNLDMKNEISDNLKKNLTSLLSKIYGIPNVEIMVNVDLNFDREVTDITEFAPSIEGETTGLIRSIKELKEQVKNDGSASGVPGTDSNSDAITQYEEFNGDGTIVNKEDRTINYDLNEVRRNIIKEPGQIKNITVAIILNQSTLEGGELTDDHRNELIKLVSAAAGLETRMVEVMARDFNNGDDNTIAISSENEGTLAANLPLVGIGLLALLFVAGAVIYGINVRRRRQRAEEILESDSIDDESGVEEIDLDANDKSSYKYQIEKFVDKKPEIVAQLLRTWINED